jgi:hypothetical protein
MRSTTLKLKTMKNLLFILSIAILMVACNTTPQANNNGDEARKIADSLRFAADTAGLAQFQSWKAQNEIVNNPMAQDQLAAAAPVSAAAGATSRRTSSSTRRSSGGGSTASSSSTSTAQQKKGWSKAAKGAVIGGVAGGAAGAIINKRNRVAGGVIGGVIGAAAGYGIGRAKDKKDGRY